MDMLLQALAFYRRRDPVSQEEEVSPRPVCVTVLEWDTPLVDRYPFTFTFTFTGMHSESVPLPCGRITHR